MWLSEVKKNIVPGERTPLLCMHNVMGWAAMDSCFRVNFFCFLFSVFILQHSESKAGSLWIKAGKVNEYRTKVISVPVLADVFWISNPICFRSLQRDVHVPLPCL